MIQMKNISKIYGSKENCFYALKNVSLEIPDGSFIAIRGKSGAGKSTLLQIMGCLDTFDEGKYFIDNISVKGLKDGKLAKLRNQKVGFVLQDFSLVNHKSVLFNVMLPMFFNKIPYRTLKKTAMEALEIVGIPEQAKKMAHQLSGGQRQRVAIARALVNKPSMILADEPTGALDTETSKQIMELFQELNHQGLTIIIVTHDPTVAEYCSQIITIHDGKIIEST